MINRQAIRIRRRKGLVQCRDRWNYHAEWITPRAIGRAGTTPVPCSCSQCGNQRRNSKGENRLTLQERKALAAFRDAMRLADRSDDPPAPR